MDLVSKLFRKNTSPSRLVGFLVSNLIGLAIIAVGMQFYIDARSIWQQEDSFLKSDYLAINKIIDASHTLGEADAGFSAEEIADLKAQPWAERVGVFSRADFNVHASVALDTGRGDARAMSTAMFFEAVPEGFLDVKDNNFSWQEGYEEVPIIISKDYLALYNFGFANAAGLPRLSESLVSGIPLRLTLVSEDGTRRLQMLGRIAGYSNRFNTILVPENFLKSMNAHLTPETSHLTPDTTFSLPSRLIVDVNSPGDSAINAYLAEKGWEVAGDKSASGATYLLKVVAGTIMVIGIVITILSALILTLSLSLLMERNRRKLHSLLMLGYPIKRVAMPYWRITALTGIIAGLLAYISLMLIRSRYIGALESLGATPGTTLWSLLLILLLTAAVILLNCIAVGKRVEAAWR